MEKMAYSNFANQTFANWTFVSDESPVCVFANVLLAKFGNPEKMQNQFGISIFYSDLTFYKTLFFAFIIRQIRRENEQSEIVNERIYAFSQKSVA